MSDEINKGAEHIESASDEQSVDDVYMLLTTKDLNYFIHMGALALLERIDGLPGVPSIQPGPAPKKPPTLYATIDQIQAIVNVLKGEEELPNDWDRDPDAAPTDFEMGLYNLEQVLEHHAKQTSPELPSQA